MIALRRDRSRPSADVDVGRPMPPRGGETRRSWHSQQSWSSKIGTTGKPDVSQVENTVQKGSGFVTCLFKSFAIGNLT